ncbi:hypothetical protein N7E02_11290 [Aliirhizobium terrae]|nr:hypothetical protein [Rhizobium sp. CC-CFT758]WJH42151.1 hypothetical protein N7E02_11290 [Rhizobium sp. CC-CFT758]
MQVTDIAFEGNFISIHTQDKTGRTIVSEAHNDGSGTVPERGEQMFAIFDRDRAMILSDEAEADRAA